MNNKFLSISLIFISILISGFFITHAFTTPTANPPYTGGVINYLDGKIGIGTAEPSTILDVNGTITISSSIPTLTLGSNPNTYAYFQKYTDGNLYIYNKEIGKNLYLGTENSTDLTIDYSGKVGIGTTDPGSYKLKVQGDANITGTLTAGGFTGPVSGTLSAANVSAGSFGANTGGGNYSFPSIIYAGADFRVAGDGYTIMNGNQFYCNNANNCHFNYSGTGGTHVGNSAGTTLYGPVSIGSTLTVSGNWSLGGLAQTNLAMGNKNILGVNKITAVTIDPLYDIGGEKYSTYVSSIAGGVKEEITGVARMKTENKSEKISYEIDFSDLKKGSDLWLFYQVTDFGENWENLVAILTPNFEGKTWYEKSPDKNKLVIFAIPNSNYGGSTSINLEVSYRLTANRVDWQKWPTLAIDQDEEAGFILKLK